MNLTQLIKQWETVYSDKVLQEFRGESRTYKEVYARAYALIRALKGLNIEPGDKVALLSSNSDATIEQIIALHLGGYVRVGLNARNSKYAHEYIINDSGAQAVIFDDAEFEKNGEYLEKIPGLIKIVRGSSNGDHEYENLLENAPDIEIQTTWPGDQVSQYQYTSGTSGHPKGAIHTHDSWLGLYRAQFLVIPEIDDTDAYLAAGPLTHAAATVVYTLLSRGGKVVVMDHYSPEAALEAIERYRCTITMLVPTMIHMLVNHPDVAKRDISSLRAIIYAGSAMPMNTLKKAHEVLGHILCQMYGQSEALPATAISGKEHAALIKSSPERLKSAGRPMADALVRIIDDNGEILPNNEIGEIAIRCASTMTGFVGEPEHDPKRFTSDGLVKTRDVGYLDSEGFLFVVDRKDDMIISGGFNIWPSEIEDSIGTHPDVTHVAVFGMPHEKWGQAPTAVVVVEKGSTLDETEILERVTEDLGSIKKPRKMLITEEIGPLSTTGKIVRRIWREYFFGKELEEQEV